MPSKDAPESLALLAATCRALSARPPLANLDADLDSFGGTRHLAIVRPASN